MITLFQRHLLDRFRRLCWQDAQHNLQKHTEYRRSSASSADLLEFSAPRNHNEKYEAHREKGKYVNRWILLVKSITRSAGTSQALKAQLHQERWLAASLCKMIAPTYLRLRECKHLLSAIIRPLRGNLMSVLCTVVLEGPDLDSGIVSQRSVIYAIRS